MIQPISLLYYKKLLKFQILWILFTDIFTRVRLLHIAKYARGGERRGSEPFTPPASTEKLIHGYLTLSLYQIFLELYLQQKYIKLSKHLMGLQYVWISNSIDIQSKFKIYELAHFKTF